MQMLLPLLEEACRLLAEPGLEAGRRRVEELVGRLQEGRLRLAVLGQFKRGKSSLINALLGQPLLPSGILPVTSVPVLLRYGPERRAEVVFQRGGALPVPPERLADYVSEEGNPGNRQGVVEVRLEEPADLLARGVEVMDTPGVGSLHRHQTRAALASLPRVDAALMVFSPDPPPTQAELDYLETVVGKVPRLLFVLNKADLCTPRELGQVTGFLQEILRSRGLPTEVLPVSARQALAGERQKSGLDLLVRRLLCFLEEEGQTVLRRSVAWRASEELTSAVTAVSLEARSLEMPAQELARAGAALAELANRAMEARKELQDRLSGERRRFEEELREAGRQLAREALDRLREVLEQETARLGTGAVPRLRSAMQEALEAAMDEFFETRKEGFLERWRGTGQGILEGHLARAQELVESYRRQVGSLFGQAVEPLPPFSVEMRWPPFYWACERWNRSLGDSLADLGRRLLPPGARARSLARFFGAGLPILCTRNANVLVNEVLERVERAIWRAGKSLDRRLEEVVQGSLQAVERARILRGEHQAETARRRASLGELEEALRRLAARLRQAGAEPAQQPETGRR